MIAGDFNVDFDRSSFCARHLYCPSIGFTYCRDGGSSFSWLDHFLCTSTCVSLTTDVRRIDFGSNHHPLRCNLGISISSSPSPASCSPSVKSRTAWRQVNPSHLDAFRFQIMNSLFQLFPVVCYPVHHSILDDICDKFLRIVRQST